MDSEAYRYLLIKTREELSNEATDVNVTFFTTLLKQCSTCISQSLLAFSELAKGKIHNTGLTEDYLNNATSILESLSNFIKTLISSNSPTCHETRTFPTYVGTILIDVFSYCKESEQQYGSNMSAKKQVIDLFSNCQNLLSTYLMVLENHFVFDLTDVTELTEALNIYLDIVKTVQSLDIKTMCVQLKAMTVAYEKYSAALADNSTFPNCLRVLCALVWSNIKIAIEAKQDDKLVMRSLKKAEILLKTILKVCLIFKQSTNKDYRHVIDLIFYIHGASSNLQTPTEKSRFRDLIVNPSKCLLEKLVCDVSFCASFFNSDVEEVIKGGSFLGYVLTLTYLMECLTGRHTNVAGTKSELIICLYSILPYCNSRHLNTTLCVEKMYVLEYLLNHSAALALTLNSEEFLLLERRMTEAILSTDHISALFSSDLWKLLHTGTSANPQLLFNQIVWLCTMYKQLEKHSMFPQSPQKVHLSHTIGRLFDMMEEDDKLKICKQFRIHDDDHLSLWTALDVTNLPPDAKVAAQNVVAEKLNALFRSQSFTEPENMDKLIKVMGLAATCDLGGRFNEQIMCAWARTCACRVSLRHARGTTWLHDYLCALTALTSSVWLHLTQHRRNLAMMLHYVTGIINRGCDEYKLLLINIICKLATTDIVDSQLDDFTAAFTSLCKSSEDIVRDKLFLILKQSPHENIDKILSNAGIQLDSLSQNKDGLDCIKANTDVTFINCKFTHKCLEDNRTKPDTTDTSVSVVTKESSWSNFDFIENVNDLLGFEESPRKRLRIDRGEANIPK